MSYHEETHTQRVRTGWYSQRDSAGGEDYPYTWCERCNGRRGYNDPQICNRTCVWRGPKPTNTPQSTQQVGASEIEQIVRQVVQEVLKRL